MLSWWQVLIASFFVLLVLSPSTSECTANNTGVPPGQTPHQNGDASIILDEVLAATSAYLKEINRTQIDIPDQESNFTFLFAKGSLSLSEGSVSGYDKIERFGSAEIDYQSSGKIVSSSAAVKFADTTIFYKIKVHISSIIFVGTIKASLEQLSMRLNVAVNLTSLCKTVESVKVEDINSIKVQSDIEGWIPKSLTNTLVKTVTWIYRNRLVPFIEERTTKAIQLFLDTIKLDELLRPPQRLAGHR